MPERKNSWWTHGRLTQVNGRVPCSRDAGWDAREAAHDHNAVSACKAAEVISQMDAILPRELRIQSVDMISDSQHNSVTRQSMHTEETGISTWFFRSGSIPKSMPISI